MRQRNIIVVGSSLGGVEALSRLAAGLPPGFPAALFVVCHSPPHIYSRLPEVLSRHGPLLASHAQDNDPIRPGHITVAPPDFHLLLMADRVRLIRGPRENHHRPAIDPLFRSAARFHGTHVIGVILTGGLSDGAAGMLAVRAAGGVAIVQDPAEAMMASMPRTTRDVAGADHVVPLAEIPPLLRKLVSEPMRQTGAHLMADILERASERVAETMSEQLNGARRGDLTVYTCPECGGVMWQLDEQDLTRFRCHTGHVYYGERLLQEQSDALEAALWTSVRTFKEKTLLARQLAAIEQERGNLAAATRFEDEARVAEQYGQLIHQHILRSGVGPGGHSAPNLGDVAAPQTGSG